MAMNICSRFSMFGALNSAMPPLVQSDEYTA